MTTPQQIIESFLREKAEIYSEANERLAPLQAAFFGEPLLSQAGDFLLPDKVKRTFEDVKQAGEFATVVTREHFTLRDLRLRYHLAVLHGDWKITRIDWECYLCRGSGRSRSGATCKKCGGEGWWDPRKDRPIEPC